MSFNSRNSSAKSNKKNITDEKKSSSVNTNKQKSLINEAQASTSKNGAGSSSSQKNTSTKKCTNKNNNLSSNYAIASSSRPKSLTIRESVTKPNINMILEETTTETPNSALKFMIKDDISYEKSIVFKCNVNDFCFLIFKVLEETENLILYLNTLTVIRANYYKASVQAALSALKINSENLISLIETPSHHVSLSILLNLANVLLTNLFPCAKLLISRHTKEISALLKFIIAHIDSYVNHIQVLILLLTTAKATKPKVGMVPYFPLKRPKDFWSSSCNNTTNIKKFRHTASTSGPQINEMKKFRARPIESKTSKYKRADFNIPLEDSSSEDSD